MGNASGDAAERGETLGKVELVADPVERLNVAQSDQSARRDALFADDLSA